MYTSVNIFTILFLLSKLNFGHAVNIPSCVFEACERITDPEYLTTSCCEGTDYFVNVINECKGESESICTCEQATCVLDKYDSLTDGELDYRKVEKTIIKLDELYPDQKPLNALVKKYCVRSNYTCFPSEDPDCPNWSFFNCAFFAYRIGCPITYSDWACKDIEDDVATCKPYQRRYVRELNRGCDSCSPPPLRIEVSQPEIVESQGIWRPIAAAPAAW